MLVFLWSALISWLSLKQKVVALSTCKAEYVAAATAACQVVWLRRLLGELTSMEAHPPALMVGNQLAIALEKNPVLHDRSKHIDVKFHFLRDCVDGGQIVIEFVENWSTTRGRPHQAARTSSTHGAEGDNRHGGGKRNISSFKGRIVRINYCFSCVNTVRKGGAERPPVVRL